jgi:hypothetical protein
MTNDTEAIQDCVPAITKAIQFEVIGNEIVLFNSALERTTYFNPSAALVFDLCDGKRTIREIAAKLQTRFPEAQNVLDHVELVIKLACEEGVLALSMLRSQPVSDVNIWEDRLRKYLIVASEVGHDGADAIAYFRTFLGAETVDKIVASVQAELKKDPFDYFDVIYCINLDEAEERWRSAIAQFERVNIAGRVRRFSAIRTPSNHHAGCALSHRAIIRQAELQGLRNVLIFEDDVIFTVDALSHLSVVVQELDGRDWDILYLGGCRWRRQFPKVKGCTRLEYAGAVTCSHAIAYRQTIFRRILEEVPADIPLMQEWLECHRGLDQFIAFQVTEKKYVVAPAIATQLSILVLEDESVLRRLPNDTHIKGRSAAYYNFAGDPEHALRLMDEAGELHVWCIEERAAALYNLGRFREAIEAALSLTFQTPRSRLYCAAAHEALGELTRACEIVAEAIASDHDLTTEYVEDHEFYRDPAIKRALIDLLIRAGLPERAPRAAAS